MSLNLPPHAMTVMVVVGALLIIGSLTRLVLRWCYPDKDFTELRQRTQSWWWMIAILFLALIISKSLTIVFFGFLSFLALKEFLSVVPTRHTDRRAIFWAYAAIPVQYYWVSEQWYGMFVIFIPVYLFLLLPMRLVLIGETRGFIRSAGILHWATMISVYSISHVAYLVALPVKNEAAGYIGPILFVLFLTQFNDVAQYVWGKLLGKHKIIPRVSPNKTWEGFLGGFVTITLCSAFLAPYLTPLTTLQGLAAGAIINVGGFFGDVVMSSVKRDLDIKDYGSLIPGHGGILDRLDSLTYTAPLFFHFLHYTCY